MRMLSEVLRAQYGEKVYKLSLSSGCTCPNRDGTVGVGGCAFCSAGGSGDFAAKPAPIEEQIAEAKQRIARKTDAKKFIAYFQSFTNTYGDVERLEALYRQTLERPEIVALSLGTRPDCLGEPVMAMLKRLNAIKPVWVELGLQTAHDETAARMNRGYPLAIFTDSFRRLKAAGLTVIVHLIFGLPGETREDMLDTVRFAANLTPPADGVKLQMLHILKGTALGAQYETAPFPLLSLEEYAELIAQSVRILPQSTVLHRLTGDAPGALLLAPEWTRNKKRVLNTIRRLLPASGEGTAEAEQTPQVALTTADLVLRTLTAEDLDELARMWNAPNGVTREEAQTVLRGMEEDRKQNRPNAIHHLCLGIFEKRQPKKLIGWCGLDGRTTPGQTVLFYLLEEGSRDRGFATQCAKELLRYAFEDMNCDRVESGCAKDNLASLRVMEKAGMRLTSRTKHGGWVFTMDKEAFQGLEQS